MVRLKILTPPEYDFEPVYLKVREKEGRLYDVNQIRKLPDVPVNHPHFKEWKIRKAGLTHFIEYVSTKKEILSILEVGCGNGWFGAAVADHFPDIEVTGCDLNMYELKLADKAFELSNFHLIYADIFKELQKEIKAYDLVVLPSSAQYFPDFDKLIITLLKLGAEVHIMDTPFYEVEQLKKAASRSTHYYHRLGFPKMAEMYFHHSIQDLNKYKPQFLYKPPTGWKKRFARSPFPWVRLTKPQTK